MIIIGAVIGLPFAAGAQLGVGNVRVAGFSVFLEVVIILIVLGTYGTLLVLWVPALRTAAALRRTTPAALVSVVYLPPVADRALHSTWPDLARPLPSRAVLIAYDTGISVWSAGRQSAPQLTLRWDDVERVEAAEYVDRQLAVQGLAFVAPGGEPALPALILPPSVTVVRPVHGRELLAVAADVDRVRTGR